MGEISENGSVTHKTNLLYWSHPILAQFLSVLCGKSVNIRDIIAQKPAETRFFRGSSQKFIMVRERTLSNLKDIDLDFQLQSLFVLLLIM